MLEPCTD